MLTNKMEDRPYHLHLCLSERDFLPGGCIFDIKAEVIERCSKFVVILSKHFDNSDGAHYESQIAMHLSPGLLVNAHYIIRQIILALVLTYNQLEDRRTNDVITFSFCFFVIQNSNG